MTNKFREFVDKKIFGKLTKKELEEKRQKQLDKLDFETEKELRKTEIAELRSKQNKFVPKESKGGMGLGKIGFNPMGPFEEKKKDDKKRDNYFG